MCLREYEDIRGYDPMVVRTKVWRGCPDSMKAALYEHANIAFDTEMQLLSTAIKPKWFGRDDFHSAHRAILLAKDPTYYVKFGWKEKPAVKNLRDQYPYVWPV